MDTFVSGFFTQHSGFENHPCCCHRLVACFLHFLWISQSLLFCFQFGAIMNKAAMNNLVKYLLFVITKAKNVMNLKPQWKSPTKLGGLLDRKINRATSRAKWWTFHVPSHLLSVLLPSAIPFHPHSPIFLISKPRLRAENWLAWALVACKWQTLFCLS